MKMSYFLKLDQSKNRNYAIIFHGNKLLSIIFLTICRKHINAVQKSKSHSGANDLSVIVRNNRKCHEKCVLFAPQWFFD
jgi:hypothetical protein